MSINEVARDIIPPGEGQSTPRRGPQLLPNRFTVGFQGRDDTECPCGIDYPMETRRNPDIEIPRATAIYGSCGAMEERALFLYDMLNSGNLITEERALKRRKALKMSCTSCSAEVGDQGTAMLSFNAVAGEEFTCQVGTYGICTGMVFSDIAGFIDWGDGSPVSAADYGDYLGADNGKMYGTHTYEVASPEPYIICGQYTQATCNNNGNLYSVGQAYCCCKQTGTVYVYVSVEVQDVSFGGVTVVAPGDTLPLGIIQLVRAVPGNTGSLSRVSTSDPTIAAPDQAEVIINPGLASGTFSISRGGETGTVTFSVESGGVTVLQTLTFT